MCRFTPFPELECDEGKRDKGNCTAELGDYVPYGMFLFAGGLSGFSTSPCLFFFFYSFFSFFPNDVIKGSRCPGGKCIDKDYRCEDNGKACHFFL